MEQGTRTRTTAATHMNANSSRSHMLIILQLKQVQVLYIYIIEMLVSVVEYVLKMSLPDFFQREHHKAVHR